MTTTDTTQALDASSTRRLTLARVAGVAGLITLMVALGDSEYWIWFAVISVLLILGRFTISEAQQ